ncbi:MAG: alginate export family protein [Proteobacteria bacterium]|nr:alginate export family protein [Pseudomonadota bacterium]
MKKVFSTVAALGLVAGIATSAAALELKVKGEYLLDGYSVSDGLGINNGLGVQMQDNVQPEGDTNAWFEHKFQTDADLVINDAITIKSRIRFIDWGIWGSQDDTDVSDGANLSIRRLWMVYKSPVGIWEIGRRPAGAWENSFVNTATRGDRIMWKSGKMISDTFDMYAFYQKITEEDSYINDNGRDYDYYEVYGAFTGYGKTSLAAGYYDNQINDIPGGSTTDRWRIKGYGDYQFTDMLGLEFEFDYINGTTEYNTAGVEDTDISGLAFMADLQANFGAAQANFMYFYISGDDDKNDNDSEAYSVGGGTGADFEPLYVLTGAKVSLLNNDMGSSNDYGKATRTAGAHGLVAAADFQATEKLGLHGAFGWAKAASEMPGYDSDYGYEFDAGASYKLLDNLTYNLHFGYLVTGDFYQMGNAAVDTNDITLLYNNLSMTF